MSASVGTLQGTGYGTGSKRSWVIALALALLVAAGAATYLAVRDRAPSKPAGPAVTRIGQDVAQGAGTPVMSVQAADHSIDAAIAHADGIPAKSMHGRHHSPNVGTSSPASGECTFVGHGPC